MIQPRVLLLTLSERTSARTGRRYMSGWLGKASVVVFEADEPDRYGNAQWEVFVSTPEPRAEGKPTNSADSGRGEERPPRVPARPVEEREGWAGSLLRCRRPRQGPPTATRGAPLEVFDDALEDIGRLPPMRESTG